jgi:hypothetical protein
MPVREIIGVDFSGAAEAGRNAWVARCKRVGKSSKLTLIGLDPLERLAGASKRDLALAWLVKAIRESRDALWGIDFPFGLPIELGWNDWPAQLKAVSDWTGATNAFGRECCDRAMKSVGKLHTRRDTDRETRTPFDCYHYRIVYQMFHGMRDVLLPLRDDPATCVLPFDVASMSSAKRIVAEACPGSTLKRLGLPHSRYKQSKPGRVAVKYKRVREVMLAGLAPLIDFDEQHRRTMLNNPGGDALDAAIAAVGTWDAYRRLDAKTIANHPRYTLEGLVYC